MLKGTGCVQVEGSLRDGMGWQLPTVAQTMAMVQVHRVGRSRLPTIEDITVRNMDLQVLAGLSDMVHAVNKFGICMDCLMPSAVCMQKESDQRDSEGEFGSEASYRWNLPVVQLIS